MALKSEIDHRWANIWQEDQEGHMQAAAAGCYARTCAQTGTASNCSKAARYLGFRHKCLWLKSSSLKCYEHIPAWQTLQIRNLKQNPHWFIYIINHIGIYIYIYYNYYIYIYSCWEDSNNISLLCFHKHRKHFSEEGKISKFRVSKAWLILCQTSTNEFVKKINQWRRQCRVSRRTHFL